MPFCPGPGPRESVGILLSRVKEVFIAKPNDFNLFTAISSGLSTLVAWNTTTDKPEVLEVVGGALKVTGISGGGTPMPQLTLTTSTKTVGGSVPAGAYQLLFDNIGPSDCAVAGKTLKPGAALPLESAGGYAAVPYTITAGGSLEITEGR